MSIHLFPWISTTKMLQVNTSWPWKSSLYQPGNIKKITNVIKKKISDFVLLNISSDLQIRTASQLISAIIFLECCFTLNRCSAVRHFHLHPCLCFHAVSPPSPSLTAYIKMSLFREAFVHLDVCIFVFATAFLPTLP